MFYLSEMYLSKSAKCITSKILKKTINNYLLHLLLILTITMTMVFSFLLRFFKIIFLTSYLYLYWEPFFKVTRRSLCELGFRGLFSGQEHFWPLSSRPYNFVTFSLYTLDYRYITSFCVPHVFILNVVSNFTLKNYSF